MNTGKQTAKAKKAGREVVASALTKQRKVKVVDVKLSADKKKTPVAKQAAGKKTQVKEEKKQAVAKKKAAQPVTKAKGIAEKVTAAPAPLASSVETIQENLTPSRKVLKTFRDAAKQNRKLLREKMRSSRASGRFLAKPPQKGKGYLLDLRVHSPASVGYFSPGGVEPISAIVRLAKVKGLHMIGLTDFCSAVFVDRIKEKAANANVIVLPGLDLRCEVAGCCEVSLVALFPEHTAGEELLGVLAELQVPDHVRGHSSYVITLPFERILQIIEAKGGIVIPSRIDKTPYRQLAIPTLVEEYGFHAFDLVHPENPEFFKKRWPSGEFTFFSFSNANALGQIGNRSVKVKLSSLGFEGLKERVQRRAPIS